MTHLSTWRRLYAWLPTRDERLERGAADDGVSTNMAWEALSDADAYRTYVRTAAEGDHPSDILVNRSGHHAAIVMEVLFSKARERVCILSNALSVDVHCAPPTLAAARQFLQRNPAATIEVLTEKLVDRSTHGFFNALDADYAARITLHRVPEESQRFYEFNFAVADGRTYRLERDRSCREALVQFGEPEFGAHLERVFMMLRGDAAGASPV